MRLFILLGGLWLVACSAPAERGGPRSRPEPRPLVVSEHGTEQRQVVHAAGESLIPAHPQRIAALAFEDEVLALGFTPVAFTTSYGAIRPYAAAALAGSLPITPLYGATQPPYEQVLATQPDLILAGGMTSTRVSGLAAIAPTVVIEESPSRGGNRRRLRDVAAVLGVPERAEALLARYDAQVAEARMLIDAKVHGESVAVLRVRARKYQVFGAGLSGPVLYQDLGLRAPPMVQALLDKKLDVAPLDPEQLPELKADHLFVVLNPQLSSDRNAAALEAMPLWQQVPAVQRGNVYYVSQTNWLARGMIVHSVIVDEVVAALLREDRFALPASDSAKRSASLEAVFRDPRPVSRGHSLLPPERIADDD